jgi:putative redox protein
MEMKITFPGGKKVDALYKGFNIQTDQPIKAGGEGSAPEPFSLFLASIGTCVGIYVLSFCQRNEIPTQDMKLVLSFEKNQQTHMIENMYITIFLPKEFPEKYKKAVIKTAELCTVKRHMENPPKFIITVSHKQ